MFKEGVLLGSYPGSAANWQAVSIMRPVSGPTPEGRYVLLQENNNETLRVGTFTAFGGNKINELCISFSLVSDNGEQGVVSDVSVQPRCKCQRQKSSLTGTPTTKS